MKAWRKAARHFNTVAGAKHQGRKNKANYMFNIVIPSNLFKVLMKSLDIIKIKRSRKGRSC